jgi:hypothetical protein
VCEFRREGQGGALILYKGDAIVARETIASAGAAHQRSVELRAALLFDETRRAEAG